MKKNQLTAAAAIELINNAINNNSFEAIEKEAKRYAFPADKEVSDALCQSKDAVIAYTTGCKEDGRMPGRSIVAAAFRHFGADKEVIRAVCIGNPLDTVFETKFAALFCDNPEVLTEYLMNNPKEDMFNETVAELAEADGWLQTIEEVEAKVAEKKRPLNVEAKNTLADFGLCV